MTSNLEPKLNDDVGMADRNKGAAPAKRPWIKPSLTTLSAKNTFAAEGVSDDGMVGSS